MQHFNTSSNKSKPLKLYITPEKRIFDLISMAVKEAYGLRWDGFVVPKSKKDKVHRQLGIDYALPCFELARSLEKSPIEVANTLDQTIKKGSSAKYSKFAADFNVKAVAGYLNFNIHDKALVDYVAWASDWFKTPSLMSRGFEQTQLLVVDNQLLGLPVSDVVESTIRYLGSMHRLFKCNFRFKIINQYMIQDAIENRSYSTKINKYFDKLDQKNAPNIIGDGTTQALYYSDDDYTLAVRSAIGRLRGPALLIYELDRILLQAQKRQGTGFIVMVSQKYHVFIENYILMNSGKTVHYFDITCYDPQVSRASILEVIKTKKTVRSYLNQASRLLGDITLDSLGTFNKIDLLLIAHLPDELSTSFAQHKLPILFDGLTSLPALIKAITSRKHMVKVSTNKHRMNKKSITVK